MIKKYLSTVLLGNTLLVVSILSLFIGVIDIDLNTLMAGGDGMELKIFLLSRIPRLLAILCTGVGMSVAGLIMQQLCMNKFVSPSTGATIQSAQFGILLSLVFFPAIVGQSVVSIWHVYSGNMYFYMVCSEDPI